MIRRCCILAVAATALVSGCSADPEPIDSFTIKFQLDTEGDAATCLPGVGRPPPLTCESYGLSCDARVAIRLYEVPDEEDAPPQLLDDPACLRLPWRETIENICSLGDRDLLAFPVFGDQGGIRPVRGYVEVTVWPDSEAVQNCPMIGFDVVGRPLPDQGARTPAFGRRVVFDFGGQDPVAEVPLACTAPQALDEPSCEPPVTYDFEIHATNIADLLNVEEDAAASLLVRAGQPTPDDTTVTLDDFHIVPAQTVELGLIGGSTPYWREDDVVLDPTWDFAIDEGADICAIITVLFSDPRATCTTITAEQAAMDVPLSVDAFMVDMETWDNKIKTAIGLNVVPNEGLVLGRVVETSGAAMDEAVVTTTGPGLPPVIQYLNDDLTDWRDDFGVPLTETSTSGYFVAQGASLRTTWSATAPNNYRSVDQPRTGQLNNRTITLLVIEMAQDFGP